MVEKYKKYFEQIGLLEAGWIHFCSGLNQRYICVNAGQELPNSARNRNLCFNQMGENWLLKDGLCAVTFVIYKPSEMHVHFNRLRHPALRNNNHSEAHSLKAGSLHAWGAKRFQALFKRDRKYSAYMTAPNHTVSSILQQETTNVYIDARLSYEVYCLLVCRRVVWYLFTTVSEKHPDSIYRVGYAVAQLVEALCYKSGGRGFDSRWCHSNILLT
jgi:hypothetical protein